jgi:hypothetical protein
VIRVAELAILEAARLVEGVRLEARRVEDEKARIEAERIANLTMGFLTEEELEK